MQFSREKPSLLPYAVMLAIILVNLAFDAISVYRVFHMPDMSGDDSFAQRALYSVLGNEFVAMVVSVAFSVACTQWLMERRRIGGLPGYAAICIGVGYAVLSVLLSFAWWFITQAITKNAGTVGMNVLVVVNAIAGHILKMLFAVLPVLLVFRLLRKYETPASHPADLRWRALLIFSLFAWSWVLLIMQFAVPVGLSLGASYGYDSGMLPLAVYAGSTGLVLPAFIGGLLGLPKTMPLTRPLRLLLASVAAWVVCALVMVGSTYVMVRIGQAVVDYFRPGVGFSALVALIWFVVSILLCRLVVKALVRGQPPSIPVGNLELSR
ncbi:hypothetical protein EC912_102750 [Luteibacter rhizovicinus]|uniref:Uncharacterized protein n=1 Tax=Luteibacter rhizovicinus TaxID=242606 RepID=A0A4V2W4L7_9GAMM|nr:hypothetical protein [Luteibacter rhizovicinus]TCV96399.1 hypothetical protein EC912_102750 [Luteibacter rhizovicinus]